MAKLVGEPLHVVRLQSRLVKDHVEVGGSDSPLTHTLAHNEIVIPTREDKPTNLQIIPN